MFRWSVSWTSTPCCFLACSASAIGRAHTCRVFPAFGLVRGPGWKRILHRDWPAWTVASSVRDVRAARMSDAQRARDAQVQRYYEKQLNTYDAFWGVGNIHMGVFEDVSKIPDTSEDAKDEFVRGAERITAMMAHKGGLGKQAVVLDLGCGCGKALLDLAEADCLQEGDGVDLTEGLVERARTAAAEAHIPERIEFHVGGFEEVTSILHARRGTFTHVFSQVSLCYAHDRFREVLEGAAEMLQPEGKLVLCDLVGSEKPPSIVCELRVLRRLCLEKVMLLPKSRYTAAIERDGRFVVDYQADLTEHLAYAYELLAKVAPYPLAEDYAASAQCCRDGEVGMVLVVAHKIH